MDLSLTVLEILLAGAVAFFGTILQGSIGFGLGLIGVPLLVIINPVFVPGPLLLAALILNLFISGRKRKTIDTLRLKWAILGRAFGTGLGAGTFSGFMGTTSAIGGPPVALVYQRKTGPQLRGTLSAIFIFGTVFSLLTLTLIHRFGRQELLAGVALLPGVLLGFFFSTAPVKMLDRGFIRPVVLIASAVSGAFVILKSLL